MNKHFILLLGLIFCVPALWAEPVDKEQAMQKAQRFYSDRGQTSKVRKLKQVPRAAEVSTAMENDCFYVFNAGEDDGYVIISGDDRTPDVLGYCDSGSFSADDMPENMRAWLDEYASQIRYLQDMQAREANLTGALRAAAGGHARIATHPAIEPQVETRWNQNAPYNNQCPVFFNESKYGHAVTGCVAAAMAQVMKAWNYPSKSLKAIPGYTCQVDWSSYIGSSSEAYITVPGMGVTTFDWNNMLNTYDSSASDTQKKAVATLMQACATALQAEFGINNVGGTSASADKLKSVLTEYFNYDKGMQYVDRTSYTADEWDALIYSEMKAYRPVFFSGRSAAGGHTFIVDGYDGNGYYHVNWGWGGLNNGYFLLSVLTPEDDSGIGAGKGGYNWGINALIGVMPNAGRDNPVTDVLTTMGGKCPKNTFTRSSTSDDFKEISVAHSFYNYTGSTATFDMGYGIYDSSKNLKVVIPVKQNIELQPNRGYPEEYTNATFNFGSGISSGNYLIMPISKVSKSNQWKPCANAWATYRLATISGNTLTLAAPYQKMSMDINVTNSPEANGPADLQFKITNHGADYIGYYNIKTLDAEAKTLTVGNLEIKGGETLTLNVSVVIEKQGTTPVAFNIYGSPNPLAAISVHTTAPKEQKLTCTYNVTNANTSRVINSNKMEMTIEYANTGSNDYDNEIKLDLMKRIGNTNSYNQVATKTDRLKLSKGSKTKRSYVFQDLENGGTYMVIPKYKTNGQYCEMNRSDFYTVRLTAPEAKEAYAVVDGSTLTFYYDGKKGDRQGKKYTMNEGNYYPDWAADSLSIRKAVIDASFKEYSPTTTAHWFEHQVNLTSIEGLTNLNTSATTIMQSMFYECYALPSLDVSKFDTRNVNDMRWMFYGCKSLTSLNVKNFNTSKVTNMISLFYNCHSLTSIDVSSFDTQNVTNMGFMFYGCSSLKSIDVSNFNTSKVQDIQAMFYECPLLTTIDLNVFDTQTVTNMGWLFYGCSSLSKIILSKKFNTSKVTNMRSMFCGCTSFINIDFSAIPNFDTGNVTDMGWMFSGCTSLNSLNLSCFNTSKVQLMNQMFLNCSSLTSLDLKSFNTANVTDMNRMFYGCTALTQVNVGSFNTSKVTSMRSMFYDCENLTTLDVSRFRSFKLQDMAFMFRGCSKLEVLDLSGFTTGPVEYMNATFYGCTSLKTIYAGLDWATYNVDNSDWMFGNCYSLVGGAGTKYDPDHIRHEYARIDKGTSRPGYFTYKAPSVKGDVNGDGTVNVADIAAIIDAMAGRANILLAMADVNGDGAINVADIAAVIDIMAANARRSETENPL